MDETAVIEYLTSQTPLFIISLMGLAVAGLALGFGICVTYFLSRKKE